MRSRGFKIYCLLLAGVILALAAEPLWSRTSMLDNAVVPDWDEDCPPGEFFTVVDENTGEEVFHTSRMVYVGDMYQDQRNRMYQVVSVEGFRGKAKFLGVEDIENPSAWFPDFLESFGSAGFMPAIREAQGGRNIRISLYHSHSDESYLPSDGASSIRDNGGIFLVGEAFSQALERNGVQTQQSKRSHDPHDKKSYQRSRRTAQEMLRQQNPNALLDIHRDALERRFYTAKVEGRELAQVQFVVGRQNPNMRSNKQFAQELKAAADKRYPGLVKGIFFGRGSYNQELNPRALLLEMGTHKSTRAEAKDGAALFAEIIASYLGAAAPNSAAGFQRENVAGRNSLLFLLGLLVVGGIAYLFLSTGSISEMNQKLKQFVGSEFTSSLGAAEHNEDTLEEEDQQLSTKSPDDQEKDHPLA